MYENAAMADSLCHINHWDHCTIPIHALEVALKLRQLDTVAFFLKNQENGKFLLFFPFSCNSLVDSLLSRLHNLYFYSVSILLEISVIYNLIISIISHILFQTALVQHKSLSFVQPMRVQKRLQQPIRNKETVDL